MKVLTLASEQDAEGVTAVRGDIARVLEALYEVASGCDLDHPVGDTPGFTAGNVLKHMGRSIQSTWAMTEDILSRLYTEGETPQEAAVTAAAVAQWRVVAKTTYDNLSALAPVVSRNVEALAKYQRFRSN